MKKNNKSNALLTLFTTFFKIGAFTFGGGYAMIPLIQHEICEKHKYIKKEDILDILAVSESTPGPIAINTATFVGFKVAGFLGALVSTLGLIIPSYFIITIVAFFFRKFADYEVIKFAFNGVRVAVVVLVFKAMLSMFKSCKKGTVPYIIMLFSFLLVVIFDVDVILVIIISALVGLSTFLLAERAGKSK